jgi:hypothetical protein
MKGIKDVGAYAIEDTGPGTKDKNITIAEIQLPRFTNRKFLTFKRHDFVTGNYPGYLQANLPALLRQVNQ